MNKTIDEKLEKENHKFVTFEKELEIIKELCVMFKLSFRKKLKLDYTISFWPFIIIN